MSLCQRESSVSVLNVRVTPRSSRSAVGTWKDGILRIHLTSPPVGGRANREMGALLAKTLGVARSCVEILSGGKGRDKRLKIVGLSQQDLEVRLAEFGEKDD
ncbi:MAG: DUF167 domain-containing protein [bacterium]